MKNKMWTVLLKKKVLLVLLSFLFLAGCLNKIEKFAPYNKTQFKSVLDASKLQAPLTKTACYQGDFAGYASSYFYLLHNKYMTFKMYGDHRRSELRQIKEWSIASTNIIGMVGKLKVFYPKTLELNEITWMQIHTDAKTCNGLSLPLIRLVWLRNYEGKQDHLWAYIRKSTMKKLIHTNYYIVDLGTRPNIFFKSELQVVKNKLTVIINDNVKVDYLDISYWPQEECHYFKAGVYLQQNGIGMVQYQKLLYYQQ